MRPKRWAPRGAELQGAVVSTAYEIDHKFPNTADGARAMLKDHACEIALPHSKIDAATVYQDPEVLGVWVLLNVCNDEEEGPDAVVYLAGYPEPMGNIREMNDFECGEVHEDDFS